MPKKDKSKFRRRLRAEILKQMAESPAERPTTPMAPSSDVRPIMPPKVEPLKKPASEIVLPASLETLPLVRDDLKKSAIIIGSIIVLIVVLYFVDFKTGILLKAGSEIFKVLHIGI